MLLKSDENIPYFSFRLLESYSDLRQVVSTRIGGISLPPYDSLNLGLGTGDERACVTRNRESLFHMLHLALPRVVTAEQIHGANIAVLDRYPEVLPYQCQASDAIITNLPDLPLVILVADCVILFLFDPRQKVIGLVHAGWRGTLQEIGGKSIERMQEVFGSQPEEILAGLSPSIGPCCYEVRDEVIHPLKKRFPDSWHDLLKKQKNGAMHFDLWEANRRQLLHHGIAERHIDIAQFCTACRNDLFYSHRKEKGKTGRFAGVFALSG